jgi:hypothetical protein
MDTLRKTVLDFTDEELLDIYCYQRKEYTEEACKIFETEIINRGLNPVSYAEKKEYTKTAVSIEPLPFPFSEADISAVDAILNNNKIPYAINEYNGLGIDDNSNIRTFSIFVYKSMLPNAQMLIEEHFEGCSACGRYIIHRMDIIDRIKTFCLNDVDIGDTVVHNNFKFSDKERVGIIRLAEILMEEIDQIEERSGRTIFFYDNLEALIKKLNHNSLEFTSMDFLAIIELLQIYCDDERYDPILNQMASVMLDFFPVKLSLESVTMSITQTIDDLIRYNNIIGGAIIANR